MEYRSVGIGNLTTIQAKSHMFDQGQDDVRHMGIRITGQMSNLT